MWNQFILLQSLICVFRHATFFFMYTVLIFFLLSKTLKTNSEYKRHSQQVSIVSRHTALFFLRNK